MKYRSEKNYDIRSKIIWDLREKKEIEKEESSNLHSLSWKAEEAEREFKKALRPIIGKIFLREI